MNAALLEHSDRPSRQSRIDTSASGPSCLGTAHVDHPKAVEESPVGCMTLAACPVEADLGKAAALVGGGILEVGRHLNFACGGGRGGCQE